MKMLDFGISFKEHPQYISLLFQITNCPYRCPECHSPELQEDIGKEINEGILYTILSSRHEYIGNVIFFGGEQEKALFLKLLSVCKKFGLKTTLWTGADKLDPEIRSQLDYLKLGKYDKDRGTLGEPNTNQRYFEVATGKPIDIS